MVFGVAFAKLRVSRDLFFELLDDPAFF